MEPGDALGDLFEECSLCLDDPWECLCDALGVVRRVGDRALREQDVNAGARALPFRGGGKGGRSDFVGREARLRGTPQHLGHDPCERLRAAPLWRTICHVRPGTVSTRDVAGFGQTFVDRSDRVGVDSQGRPELSNRRQSGAGQETARVDLVGDLPVDLGRDRDIRVTLDVQFLAGSRYRRTVIQGCDLVA